LYIYLFSFFRKLHWRSVNILRSRSMLHAAVRPSSQPADRSENPVLLKINKAQQEGTLQSSACSIFVLRLLMYPLITLGHLHNYL